MASQATAFAPASVGNVAVGFDILGHALEGAGDRVTAARTAANQVKVREITGVVRDLPRDNERNTAAKAVASWHAHVRPDFGVELIIDKGIPLGSGMGGSAASAVAALLASNALLERPLPVLELYPFALLGEAAASGSAHGDNVGPQLLGGLVLATASRLVKIPVPPGLFCVLLHPHQVLETRKARAVLDAPYPIADFVRQSAHLSLFLAGCFAGDAQLVSEGLRDVLVEPRRAALIPGFDAVKNAALQAGALGASISGAGPSIFAWCANRALAHDAAERMQRAYTDATRGGSDVWVSPVDAPGASVESCVS